MVYLSIQNSGIHSLYILPPFIRIEPIITYYYLFFVHGMIFYAPFITIRIRFMDQGVTIYRNNPLRISIPILPIRRVVLRKKLCPILKYTKNKMQDKYDKKYCKK